MGRLTGLKSSEIQADRVGNAVGFAKENGCYLVLKGARTIIAEPGGIAHLNPTGNPALSSGGSGDVLTGLIGGLIARGFPIAKAVVAGVYIHGLAADLLAENSGQAGILASELTDIIPEIMVSLSEGECPLERRPYDLDLYQPL